MDRLGTILLEKLKLADSGSAKFAISRKKDDSAAKLKAPADKAKRGACNQEEPAVPADAPPAPLRSLRRAAPPEDQDVAGPPDSEPERVSYRRMSLDTHRQHRYSGGEFCDERPKRLSLQESGLVHLRQLESGCCPPPPYYGSTGLSPRLTSPRSSYASSDLSGSPRASVNLESRSSSNRTSGISMGYDRRLCWSGSCTSSPQSSASLQYQPSQLLSCPSPSSLVAAALSAGGRSGPVYPPDKWDMDWKATRLYRQPLRAGCHGGWVKTVVIRTHRPWGVRRLPASLNGMLPDDHWQDTLWSSICATLLVPTSRRRWNSCWPEIACWMVLPQLMKLHCPHVILHWAFQAARWLPVRADLWVSLGTLFCLLGLADHRSSQFGHRPTQKKNTLDPVLSATRGCMAESRLARR
ncbi:uncharacterized protein LOC120521133 isoform X1 [Polypterus senegalus]|uniref:uncharacterized protein LOC120521133 isoform X1 n=1 Tax=Polypterus senegalus TaxID=55291 RepID=UPI0019651B50|nr:uncharacterized protein LOC120521133 isoform X1 [Polypterus senegalus]